MPVQPPPPVVSAVSVPVELPEVMPSMARPIVRPAPVVVESGRFETTRNIPMQHAETAGPVSAGFVSSNVAPGRSSGISVSSVAGFAAAKMASASTSAGTGVRGAGFAAAAPSEARPQAGAPAEGQFGAVVAKTPGVSSVASQSLVAQRSPLEIVFKPRPAYSNEARSLRIEGEVTLEAKFQASGDVLVMRVIRGLGHGLDETAMAAARAIRFQPATERGRRVDAVATVRIAFQLAD